MSLKRLSPTLLLLAVSLAARAETIEWKGIKWDVKQGPNMGPGPNLWSAANVSVDTNGNLHLKIARGASGWTCAEIDSASPMGFGTYQWQVEGPIDRLDKNVVLGLFGYAGPDGVNEIDVEFAQWGHDNPKRGSWTVYPNPGGKKRSTSFPFSLTGTYTTSRYEWSPGGIHYWFMGGHQPADQTRNVIREWDYEPENRLDIPQKPMPLCMNLWLFESKGPSDDKPVEIVIHDFRFVPAK